MIEVAEGIRLSPQGFGPEFQSKILKLHKRQMDLIREYLISVGLFEGNPLDGSSSEEQFEANAEYAAGVLSLNHGESIGSIRGWSREAKLDLMRRAYEQAKMTERLASKGGIPKGYFRNRD